MGDELMIPKYTIEYSVDFKLGWQPRDPPEKSSVGQAMLSRTRHNGDAGGEAMKERKALNENIEPEDW